MTVLVIAGGAALRAVREGQGLAFVHTSACVLEKLTLHRLRTDACFNPKAVLTLRIFPAVAGELNVWGDTPSWLLRSTFVDHTSRILLYEKPFVYLFMRQFCGLSYNHIHSFHLNSCGTDASPCSQEHDGCSFSATCCLTTRAHRTSNLLITQVQNCIWISSCQMLMVL